jgi:hypothetical protein
MSDRVTELLRMSSKLEALGEIYQEACAVFPTSGVFAWWNGSATFQVIDLLGAMRDVLAGKNMTVMLVWEDTAHHRDLTHAIAELSALPHMDHDDLPWQDEVSMGLLRGGFGHAVVFPGNIEIPPRPVT